MERFWSRVDRVDGDGCWLWRGTRRKDGYGQLMVGRKLIRAHRFAWELANGPVPAGMHLLHSCDNPPCVRPDHLRPGTQRDNLADMTTKGRRSHGDRHPWHGVNQSGEANHATHLTAQDVADIRAMGSAGSRQRDIAARFGIHQANVSIILRGLTWQGVEPSAALPPVERLSYRPKLDAAIARVIRDEYTGARGDMARLARLYGVSIPTIRAILDGRSYADS